jgi:hypothetical protein
MVCHQVCTKVIILPPISPRPTLKSPKHAETIDPGELASTALALVREYAPETRQLPIAARPVANHPEYQQVNRIGRDGAAL